MWPFEKKAYAAPAPTSYVAKGVVPTPSSALTESGSAAFSPIRDVVPELGNRRQAIEVYDRMVNNDAAVDVSLRAAKIPVQAANFFVAPYDDDQINLDIAEFVEYNLLRGTSSPFLLTLHEILRFYEYGFSVLEKVFEIREWSPDRTGSNRKKYTMLKKLAPRPAKTIKEFHYDTNGGPEGITQNFLDAKTNKTSEVEIPIEKMVIFTLNKKGGNLEGKSLLRTSYKNWYYKDNLYKIDGIQKERHALGVPRVTLPPGYNDQDKRAAHELAANLRTNERGYIVQPPGFVVDFAKFEGELADVMRSIDHHNGMIMMNVMVQFLLMGLMEGGGRATAGTHQNMFEKSLKFVAKMVCEYLNLYLIPQLVMYNFETDKFPYLNVRNIGEGREIQIWASAVANLIARNAITVDLEFEQWVRAIMDAPPKMGEKQTPENNPGMSRGRPETKGDVAGDTTDQTGNMGKAPDEGSITS